MSSRYQYTSMDRVFAKIDRDGITDFNEDDIVEWTGEALEFMRCVKSYEEAVCFVEVKNFSCAIPKWCHAIVQIAKDNTVSSGMAFTAFTKSVKETFETDVIITDNGDIVSATSGVSIASNQVNLAITYKGWIESSYYQGRFSPVRLKTASFFNSLVCQEEYDIPYYTCEDEYTIVNGDTLKFSFQEGLIAVAYLKQMVDKETGYPMIPDHVSFLSGIEWYIDLKMATKDFRRGREGSQGRMQKAEDKWNWYCKQATNIDMMPYGIDEYENLRQQRGYLLPRENQYYGFFGNLNKQEVRGYNNPNRRNKY
jgi:hypothetical protein